MNPVGRGLGATNLGGSKFGGSGEIYGTEFDISNAFSGLGLVGGILYLCLVCRVFYVSFVRWRATRDPLLLCIIAVLIMLTGRWIEGVDGVLVMLTWSLVGYVDTLDRSAKLAEAAIAADTLKSRAAATATPANQPQTA